VVVLFFYFYFTAGESHVLADHLQRLVAQDLLQGEDFPAVDQVVHSIGMAAQVRVQLVHPDPRLGALQHLQQVD